MASFEEPLVRDIIWRWLDEQKQYVRIGGEVNVGNGRIDIVAETQDGQFHGFEIKSIDGNVGQVISYAESGYLDKVYFGSGFTDTFIEKLADRGETRIGVIEAPIWGHGWDPTEVEHIINEVEKKSAAEKIPRDNTPQFQWTNESFIDHHIWRTNGILREAQISDSSYQARQIDIVDVAERPVPQDIFEQPSEYSYIGIEAKGESSFSPTRIPEQLEEYMDSGCFSEYYLAVPTSLTDRTVSLLKDEGLDEVGLMAVSEDGSVDTVKSAVVVGSERPEWHPFNEGNPTAFRVGADKDEVVDPTNPRLVPHEIEPWMEPEPSDWVTKGGDYSRQNQTPLPSLTEVDTIQKSWTHDTGKGRILAPARLNSLVVAANRHGRLYGIDAESGERRWAYTYLNKIRTAPALTEGLAIVGSGRSLVACRLSDGGIVWEVGGDSSDGKVAATPVISGNRVIAVWREDKIRCISTRTGEVEWETDIDDSVEKPLITNDELVIAMGWDTVHAFSIETGEDIWKFKPESHLSDAVADSDSIYFLTYRNLIELDWEGKKQWEESTSSQSPLTGVQDRLYAAHGSMGICEISKSDRRIKPLFDRDIEEQITGCQYLSITSETAFALSHNRAGGESITVINLREPEELCNLEVDRDLHSGFALGEHGLYTGTTGGEVIHYRISN